MRHFIIKISALIIACLFYSITIFSQIKITTDINAKKIGTEDVLILSYSFTVPKGGVEENFPNFSGFRVVQHSKSIFNNSHEYTFHLAPVAPGVFTIEGLTLYDANGKPSTSSPVKIEVVKGSLIKKQSNARNQSRDPNQQIDRIRQQLLQQNPYAIQQLGPISDHFFIVAESTKDNYYIGEPIYISYKLYNNVGYSSAQIINIPKNSDFLSKNFDFETEYEENIVTYNGRNYNTVILKNAILYGFKTGTFEIGGMSISAFVDYFGRAEAQTKKKTITIKPLPPTKLSFNGGVGQFAISTQLNKVHANANDPITYTITISGNGNIDAISPPSINWPQGITVSEPTSEIIHNKEKPELSQKSYTYIITADKDTSVVIPESEWTYFDPSSGQYRTLNTSEQPISFFPPTENSDSSKVVMKDYTQEDGAASEQPSWKYIVTTIIGLITLLLFFIFYKKRKKQLNKSAHSSPIIEHSRIADLPQKTEQNIPSNEIIERPIVSEDKSLNKIFFSKIDLDLIQPTEYNEPDTAMYSIENYLIQYFNNHGFKGQQLDIIEAEISSQSDSYQGISSALKDIKLFINTLKYNPLPKSVKDINILIDKVNYLSQKLEDKRL